MLTFIAWYYIIQYDAHMNKEKSEISRFSTIFFKLTDNLNKLKQTKMFMILMKNSGQIYW